MKRTTISLKGEVLEAAERQAAIENRTLSNFIDTRLRDVFGLAPSSDYPAAPAEQARETETANA